MPSLTERFATNLYKLRRANKMSQEDLAKKLGITQGYVSQLETGVRTPSIEQVEACGAALGVDPRRLFA